MDQQPGRQSSENHPIKNEKTEKNQGSLKDFWDNIMHTNILITGFPEAEERKEKLFKDKMAEYLPNLSKEKPFKYRKHILPYKMK